MDLVNVIKHCLKRAPDKQRHRMRRLDSIGMVVIHRSHLEDTAEATSSRFDDVSLGTGGKMPYHFVVEDDGTVKQCLPLSAIGPGALYNKPAIHVAVHGDLRNRPVLPAQAEPLLQLCLDLCSWLGAVVLWGHTEIPGSSTDPLKECPGAKLNLDGLRAAVMAKLERWPHEIRDDMLKRKGYVL